MANVAESAEVGRGGKKMVTGKLEGICILHTTSQWSSVLWCGLVFLLLFSPFCFELRELTLGSMALITDVFGVLV